MLATAIAETSLTIEGVRVVIDSGVARVARYDVGARVSRLETVRVSRASADQRRGRAGRTEPGVCYRLWHQPETAGLRPFEELEIVTADLTSLLLDCAAWGIDDLGRLTWLEHPSQGNVQAAREMLISIGAFDAAGRVTPYGKALRELALPPHLAAMVVTAVRHGQARVAAELAALLVERGVGGRSTDIEERLRSFRRDRSARARQLRDLALRWAKTAERVAEPGVGGEPELSIGAVLAIAFPDRIARRRGSTERYLMANGREGRLVSADWPSDAEFLVVGNLQGNAAGARILAAAMLDVRELEVIAAPRIEQAEVVEFDVSAKAVRARIVRRLEAIRLSEEPIPAPVDEATAGELARGVVEALGVSHLPWSKAQLQLRARIGYLRASDEVWPDLSDDALAASSEIWLAPFLVGMRALSDISANELAAALDVLVPWELKQRLNKDAPTHFEVPTGSQIAIDYDGEQGPSIAVRVQELYGLTEHPAIVGGRLPLTLELLSPAQRPIQVTRDLPGFWSGSWRDVKAEMKGRYPKHLWPDDPANAVPTRRVKGRS